MSRRRGWGRGQAGAFGWRRIYRFVEPCLLLLLHRDRTYGYDLLEGLKEFGFDQTPIDSSVVYRALRDMEAQGLVTSTWEISGGGPPRRVYRITATGHSHLARWVGELQETDRVLHSFLAAYYEHMQEGEGEHHSGGNTK